jgi:ParB-like chromosome segregation protein Spo0J
LQNRLEINKQYRPIVVQKSTNKILAGNHTWLAAQSLGWEEIAVVYVDVDDVAAKRIVLADNRTNDLADYDGQILAELFVI